MKFNCLSCHDKIQIIDSFSSINRITSDCKSFVRYGHIGQCRSCGLIQKPLTKKLLDEISFIYSNYQAYEVADGVEQIVFDSKTNKLMSRSHLILKHTYPMINKQKEGIKIIDIGCGDGVTLSAFNNYFKTAMLYGHEISSSKKGKLSNIENFKKLYTGDIGKIKNKFNVVSMIHSLEHFINPLETLINIKRLMDNKSLLIIEVCDVTKNPYDISIADHITHFSIQSLTNLLKNAGFNILEISNEVISKEITCIAKIQEQQDISKTLKSNFDVKFNISFLEDQLLKYNKFSKENNDFGFFGTSIAASWLINSSKIKPTFFVDEDPNRVGKFFFDKPIIHPSEVNANSVVYFSLAPSLINILQEKFHHYEWKKAFASL